MVLPRYKLSLYKKTGIMRIIQSYWSKPFNMCKTNENARGGWCNPTFFYMSWALSCITLRRFYRNVELYTDQVGADLLINKLELPYTKVHVVLDKINKYDSMLWAIGKLYTYGLQESPFLHVDGDVYIWNCFPKRVIEGHLIAQHLEDAYPYNVIVIEQTLSKLKYLPIAIEQVQNRSKEINAGILGGDDLDFFHLYTQEAFNFVDKNLSCVPELKYPGMFNTIFEQFLFSCMSEYYGKNITYGFDNVDARFKRFGEFELVPNNYYIHALAFYKKMFCIGEAIAYHLYKMSPRHYELIIDKLKKKEL